VRLQLSCRGLVAALLAASTARAEPPPDEVSGTLRVYADDDHLTVVSPSAHGQVAAARLAVDLDVAVDAVSAASVDVMTSASPRAVTERRVEAGVGVTTWPDARVAVRLGALVSHEHDYDVLRGDATVTAELAERNTTLALRGQLELDRATAVGDPTFRGERRGGGVLATATQLIDRRTIADLAIDARLADGWHGSPYRSVIVHALDQPTFTRWPEATPAVRRALAAAVRVRRAIGERWVGAASARGYLDDWDLHSATATLEARRALPGAARLGLVARGYLQDGASFWRRQQPDGAMPPALRTADRTLGPMASAQLEVIGERGLGAARVVAAVGGVGLWYLDAAAQSRRLAITTTLSVTWSR